MSGGVIPHEDPTDKTYIETSPAGYTMLNGWGSARYNTAMQLCALVYQKYHPDRTDLVIGQRDRWNISWEEILWAILI